MRSVEGDSTEGIIPTSPRTLKMSGTVAERQSLAHKRQSIAGRRVRRADRSISFHAASTDGPRGGPLTSGALAFRHVQISAADRGVLPLNQSPAACLVRTQSPPRSSISRGEISVRIMQVTCYVRRYPAIHAFWHPLCKKAATEKSTPADRAKKYRQTLSVLEKFPCTTLCPLKRRVQ
jgi:hypothetical protein